MARIEEMHHRLLNWARWRAGGRVGGLGYAAVQWNTVATRASYRESVIPTSDAEAAETEEGVQRLEEKLRRALELVYVEARAVRRAAPLLQCSPATVQLRVELAQGQLRDWLTERARQRQAERDRVESLQHAQRPADRSTT